jgi:hypothetical protein
MKKLLFVLALVAVYTLSISHVSASVSASGKAKVTVVATDNTPSKDDPKKADVKKEVKSTVEKTPACCAAKAEGAAGCAKAKEAGGCPMSKTCAGEKEAVPAPKK